MMAPEIVLSDMEEQLIPLSKIKAEYVLLIFWSPECDACLEALQLLRGMRNKYSNEQLQIYAVALTSDPYLWDAMLKSLDVRWVNAIDTQGAEGAHASAYGIRSIPSYFLIDRSGKILAEKKQIKSIQILLDQLLSPIQP